MKTKCILIIAAALIFCFSGVVFADNWKDESGQGRGPGSYKERGDDRGRPDNDGRGYGHDRRNDKKDRDYRNHRGYRPKPFDRGRVYVHHEHRGHRYEYHGHWSSWDHWDRYAKSHPAIIVNGNYYRENAHLMFRFCEPGTANCVFFSIGK
jgi:hypothetical protein